MVEAIAYENTVNGLVEVHRTYPGLSREQLMCEHTLLIMQEMDLPKAASLAATAIAMLAEERTPV